MALLQVGGTIFLSKVLRRKIIFILILSVLPTEGEHLPGQVPDRVRQLGTLRPLRQDCHWGVLQDHSGTGRGVLQDNSGTDRGVLQDYSGINKGSTARQLKYRQRRRQNKVQTGESCKNTQVQTGGVLQYNPGTEKEELSAVKRTNIVKEPSRVAKIL